MESYTNNEEELLLSGMKAWNKLTGMIDDGDGRVFNDINEFKQFYAVVMSNLLAEEESD